MKFLTVLIFTLAATLAVADGPITHYTVYDDDDNDGTLETCTTNWVPSSIPSTLYPEEWNSAVVVSKDNDSDGSCDVHDVVFQVPDEVIFKDCADDPTCSNCNDVCKTKFVGGGFFSGSCIVSGRETTSETAGGCGGECECIDKNWWGGCKKYWCPSSYCNACRYTDYFSTGGDGVTLSAEEAD